MVINTLFFGWLGSLFNYYTSVHIFFLQNPFKHHAIIHDIKTQVSQLENVIGSAVFIMLILIIRSRKKTVLVTI